MEKLTVEQRRMVIDYYTTKLVEEWPAALTGQQIENRMYEAALLMEARLNRFINKYTFNNLIEFMLDQQTFDRDPAGWLNENGGWEDTAPRRYYWKQYMDDMISALINDIAGV